MHLRRLAWHLAVLLLGAAALARLPSGPAQAADPASSHWLLNHLTVHKEHASGYDRDLFRLWTDADGDNCDTRYEVLIAEAVKAPSVGSSCQLTGGKWRSKYDDAKTTNPSTFDIDHLVALNEAWQSGAWRWTSGTRERYANDLTYKASLIAVTASSNRSKGDREPQTWLPPRVSYRCTYMARWVAVKWRWDLRINKAEKTFLATELAACGWPDVHKPARAAVHLG